MAFYSSKLQTGAVKIRYLLNRRDMNRRVGHVIKRMPPRITGAQLPEPCKFVPGRHFFREYYPRVQCNAASKHEHNLIRIPSVLKDLRPESFFTPLLSVYRLRCRRRAGPGFAPSSSTHHAPFYAGRLGPSWFLRYPDSSSSSESSS